MSETGNRSVRTAAQAVLAGIIVDFVDVFFYDLSDRQFGASVALLTVLITFVQNLVESRKGAGLLRDDLS
jgi:hypothetical protein